MKKTSLIIIALFMMINVSFSQRVHKIILADKGASITTGFLLNENVVVFIGQDGSISEWGVDRYADRAGDQISRKLDTYGGRIEYYTDKDNEAFRGKIKYIGNTMITYFASFDDKDKAGRIKTIGTIPFNYFTTYDDPSAKGKIRMVGRTAYSFYTNFDNDAYKNKIKSVGTVGITYFATTDDKALVGKVKSVNNRPFTYYTSQDQPNLRGVLKTGSLNQVINGVTYQIKP
jgi:hypothetical protein